MKRTCLRIQRKEKGVYRLYEKVISKSSSKESGTFMKANTGVNANVKTDEPSHDNNFDTHADDYDLQHGKKYKTGILASSI